MEKAKLLISLAPMPEEPVDARLAWLLVPAPHVVPEKKAKKVATGTRKSSRFQVSDDSEADSSPEDEEEEEDSLREEGERKRKASPTGGPKGPRGEELFPRTAPPTPMLAKRSGLQGLGLQRDRKYPDPCII